MTFRAFSTPNDLEAPVNSMSLDCFCDSCGRHITMEELRADFHDGHKFSAIEMAALQAMRAYLKSCDPALAKQQFPHA